MKIVDWNKAAYVVDAQNQRFEISHIEEHDVAVLVFGREVLCAKPVAWADVYDKSGKLLRSRLKTDK